jgi:hypothetical protein
LLASIDCRPKNIRVLPVVIAELELGNIEQHIFAAHCVECADHAALENRPEAFDGLSMDCANDILPSRVVNSRVWIIKRIVAWILVGAKQADSVRNRFADECGESGGIHVRGHAGDHIALAADGADDWSFAGPDASRSTAPAALIPMPVFCQAANKSFIHFDNSAKLIDVLHKGGSDLMAHEPRGPIRTKAHIAIDLQSTHALLARKHEMDNAEPLPQGLVRVLENRSCDMGEAVISSGRRAFVAQPVPLHCAVFLDHHVTATGAGYALRPAMTGEIGATSIFVRESFFPFGDGHLMDWLGLLCAGHTGTPSLRGQHDTVS